MIPSQHLITIELLSSFKPVLMKHFGDKLNKLYCNCNFNSKEVSIELQNVKSQSLRKRVMLNEKLCSSKIRLVLKSILASKKKSQSFATFEHFICEKPEIAML